MPVRRLAAVLVVAVVAAGCRAGGEPSGDADEIAGSLTVLAASSLTEAFTDLASRFEARRPGASVTLSFAGSPVLVQQVLDGAPAEVLATADPEVMDRAVAAGAATAPSRFASNRLVLAVPQGNPERLTGLADLARPGMVLLACAPEVPCGRLAARALGRLPGPVVPRSLEANVKAVATKVLLGEADAGLVYHSDVVAAAGLDEVAVEPPVATTLSITVLEEARNAAAARAFVAFVLSPEGREVLTAHGFGAP